MKLLLLIVALAQGAMLLYLPPVRFMINGVQGAPVVTLLELCQNASCVSKAFTMTLPNVILMADNNTVWNIAKATVNGKVITASI